MPRKSARSIGAKVYVTLVVAILVLTATGFFGWLDKMWRTALFNTSDTVRRSSEYVFDSVGNHFDNADAKEINRNLQEQVDRLELSLLLTQSQLDAYQNVLAFMNASYESTVPTLGLSKVVYKTSRTGTKTIWVTIASTWRDLDQLSPMHPITSATISAATPMGLVGRVVEIEKRFARLVPIYDLESNISVRVGAIPNAIAHGTGKNDELELLFLPRGSRVRLGDLVSTNGQDGFFPAGIPVGTVTAVNTPKEGMYDIVTVQSTQSASNLRNLWLLYHQL